jgi:hypothetical protein
MPRVLAADMNVRASFVGRKPVFVTRRHRVILMAVAALLVTKEIARYRPALYRLALLPIRDNAAAEDATQETLLAALEGIAAYAAKRASRPGSSPSCATRSSMCCANAGDMCRLQART